MDATPAVLVWDRGALEAECDRAAIVRQGVETYLQRDVFADGDADTASKVVRVRLSRIIENDKPRVVAQVSQEDPSGATWGERSVSGDDTCASLDEPLTLVVALLVDSPEPEEPAVPAPPPDVPEPEPDVPEPPQEIITAPSLQQPAVTPGHFVMLGFAAASVGATPELGLGAGLAVSLKPRGFWGIGLEGTLLGPSRQTLDSGSLTISFAHAALSLCPLQGTSDGVWWSACVSLGGARLHARSHGLLGQHAHTQWLPMPGLSLRGAHIVGRRWLLAGGLVAALPVGAERYVYRDAAGRSQPAFQLSPLVLTAQLGVGLLFN